MNFNIYKQHIFTFLTLFFLVGVNTAVYADQNRLFDELEAQDDTVCFKENSANRQVDLHINDLNAVDSIAIFVAPMNGIVTVQSNEIWFTPTTNFIGYDSLTYIIFGGTAVSDTATILIEIIPKAIALDDFVYNNSLCGDTVILSANDPDPGRGKWSLDIGDGVFVDETNPNTPFVISPGETELDLKWVITSDYGCASSAGLEIDITNSSQHSTTLSIDCPNEISEPANENCEFMISDYSKSLDIISNCSRPFTVSQSVAQGTIITAAIDVKIYIADRFGIDSSCTITIFPEDTTPPTLNCPEIQKVSMNQNCQYELIDITNLVAPSDNCSSLFTYMQSPSPGALVSSDTIVIVSVDDNSGNQSECAVEVQLIDTVVPEISCPENIVSCDQAIVLASPTYFDNCDPSPSLEEARGFEPEETYEFPIGTTQITYTVSDAFLNKQSCSYAIEIITPPNVDWGGIESILCVQTDSISLDQYLTIATGGTWSGVGVKDRYFYPPIAGTGLHAITYQRSNMACENDSTRAVDVKKNNLVDLPNDSEVCGKTVALDFPTNVSDGSWSIIPEVEIDDSTQFNTTITAPNAGNYELKWTEYQGDCPTIASGSISFYEEPDITYAGENQKLIYLFSANMNASTPSIGTSFWRLNRGSGTIEDKSSPTTSIKELDYGLNDFEWVTVNGPCSEKIDVVTVEVIELKIPEGISPNGDLANDYFVVPGLENASKVNMKIYSRWGNLVFEDATYSNNWNGQNQQGEELPDDTYYYNLEIDEVSFSGSVMIKR